MEIKQDNRNYRRHSDKNKRIIKKSLDEFGAGRSILIDNEGEIIAGNGVMEQWGNKPIKVVETDGTELIVVKRTDLNTNDEKRKQLALIDNHASDTSEFDFDFIKDDFDSVFLDGYELKINEGKLIEELEEEFGLNDQEIHELYIKVSKHWFENIHREIRKKIKESNLSDEVIEMFAYVVNYYNWCKSNKRRFSIVVPLQLDYCKKYSIDINQITSDFQRYLYEKYNKPA